MIVKYYSWFIDYPGAEHLVAALYVDNNLPINIGSIIYINYKLMIEGITACSMKQAEEFNTLNNKEALNNKTRASKKNKLQSRDYSGCKFKKVG